MSKPAFELTSTTTIGSLGLELRQYQHAATGARRASLVSMVRMRAWA